VDVTSRYESVSSEGDQFDAYCAVPESGSGPGVLLFQEIFGINDNIRQLADRLAGAGYVTLAPDMFWRIERRFERKDESGLADAFAMVQKLDFEKAADDIRATHAHLVGMPECTGKIGAVGFCLGGALAFVAATQSRVDGRGIDAAVCYYGSAINDMLDHVAGLECPSMYHYGSLDAFITSDMIDQVEAALQGRPGVEFHRYAAGHAFSNSDAPSMYNEAAADEAWTRTLDFFARHLRLPPVQVTDPGDTTVKRTGRAARG
jgi:carboxymethylenebutenolidase